jgi:hypothetical protein
MLPAMDQLQYLNKENKKNGGDWRRWKQNTTEVAKDK